MELQVARGETLAVLGRSGTGKSVLLQAADRSAKAGCGSICISREGNHQISDRKQLNEVRKKIGFFFQQAALYDSHDGRKNVSFRSAGTPSFPRTSATRRCPRAAAEAWGWTRIWRRCRPRSPAACKAGGLGARLGARTGHRCYLTSQPPAAGPHYRQRNRPVDPAA